MRSSFWAVLSALLLSVGGGWGTLQAQANAPVVFRNFSVDDGLSHNFVREVLQDSTGLMWLATEDGLNKFDGYQFQTYRGGSTGQPGALTDHPIMALAEDLAHNIWVGTWGGGVFVYDRQLDRFHALATDVPLPSPYIYDLFCDRQGRMWIGTGGGGLVRCDLPTGADSLVRLTAYQHARADVRSLGSNRVYSIAEGPNGHIWVATLGGGVNQLDPETGSFVRYQHHPQDPKSLSSNDVYVLFFDRQDRLWVGTWDAGLHMMATPTQGFVHFRHDSTQPRSLPNDQVWALTEDLQGRLWVGTDNGLARFDPTSQQFQVYRHNPVNPKSLTANSVKCLAVDRDGRLWAGTYNGGVSLLDVHAQQFAHYFRGLENPTLSLNDVSAFLELPHGQVLVGTDGGGLNVFEQGTGRTTPLPQNPQAGNGKVKTLMQDSLGRIWVGYWGGGFGYFDPEFQRFVHYQREPGPHRLTNNNVMCFAPAAHNTLWVGTYGGGLHHFDPSTGIFRTYTLLPAGTDSASEQHNDRMIWSLLVDRQHDLWVGTGSGQLARIDPITQQSTFFSEPLHGEADYSVITLFEDSQGRIWVGLEGGGLKLFQPDTQTFRSFTTRDGLPSNSIQAIEEDDQGFLWISTTNGLAHFDPATGVLRTYGLPDGLQGLHFNRQASLTLASGQMLFGGNNGFNLFHPDSLEQVQTQIPLVFTDLQLFNRPVPVGAPGSPLSAHINQTHYLELPHTASVFSIEYAALCYNAPDQVRYQYKLEGFVDERWQQVGQERKALYTNLRPGDYRFKVSIVPEKGLSSPVRTLAIRVLPPWWSTWWARVLMVLGFLALLALIYRLRMGAVRRRNAQLERLVQERTLRLQQANDTLREMNQLIQEQKEEIESQAEELFETHYEVQLINHQLEERVELRTADLKKSNEELDNFVYRVSHDVRAPLASVLGLIQLMELEECSEQMQVYVQMARQSIHKLDGFVNDILNYSRNSRLKVEHEPIDFLRLLQETAEELQYMQHAQRLEFTHEVTLAKPFFNDTRRLHIIFRNLFSNAIKYQHLHRPVSYVRTHVTTNAVKGGVDIRVEDNGMGIDPSQVDKVFEMFYRASTVSTGSGIGLYIVKESVEKLRGTVYVASQLDVGTTFHIWLPESNAPDEARTQVGTSN
ncbi:two-component regulator propeller domain-containing protein [Catalinimonas alkaloidigena]|uniref:two-component regulator propeller domain-containing protein n=1 Tax=Catalinimonas alkaloidigena TaxID=1075417 RepID=UPI0015A35392|nr:two-component regulator propeller domain-containing protein [Catalinimonas alkaloidigena]